MCIENALGYVYCCLVTFHVHRIYSEHGENDMIRDSMQET